VISQPLCQFHHNKPCFAHFVAPPTLTLTLLVGLGLQITLHINSVVRNWIGFELIARIGFRMLVCLIFMESGDFDQGYFTVCDDDILYPVFPSGE